MATIFNKQRTVLDWVFIVFLVVAFPIMLLLGYRAYYSISQQVDITNRVTQEVQVQELEHRIRSEQGRKCVLDGINALGRNEPVPMPPECESPDLDELLEALKRAEGRLLD